MICNETRNTMKRYLTAMAVILAVLATACGSSALTPADTAAPSETAATTTAATTAVTTTAATTTVTTTATTAEQQEDKSEAFIGEWYLTDIFYTFDGETLDVKLSEVGKPDAFDVPMITFRSGGKCGISAENGRSITECTWTTEDGVTAKVTEPLDANTNVHYIITLDGDSMTLVSDDAENESGEEVSVRLCRGKSEELKELRRELAENIKKSTETSSDAENDEDAKNTDDADNKYADAALAYYEKENGYRPSSFTVETNEDGSVTVHLFDDMDDHTATAAWYTFPPDSFIATDDITGETIDFSEYLDEDED